MNDASRTGLLLAHKGGLQSAMERVRRDLTGFEKAERRSAVSTQQLREAGRVAASVLGLPALRFNQGAVKTWHGEPIGDGSVARVDGVLPTIQTVTAADAPAPGRGSPAASVHRLADSLPDMMREPHAVMTGLGATAIGGVDGKKLRVVATSAEMLTAHAATGQGAQADDWTERRPATPPGEHAAAPIAGRAGRVTRSDVGDPGERLPREMATVSAASDLRDIGQRAAGRSVVVGEDRGSRRGQSMDDALAVGAGLGSRAEIQAPISIGRQVPVDGEDRRARMDESDAGWMPDQEAGGAERQAGRGRKQAMVTAPFAASADHGDDDGDADRAGDGQESQQPMQGDVFLDGALVGRWVSRFLNKEAGRAMAGPTGFDSRRNALLPGATVGR